MSAGLPGALYNPSQRKADSHRQVRTCTSCRAFMETYAADAVASRATLSLTKASVEDVCLTLGIDFPEAPAFPRSGSGGSGHFPGHRRRFKVQSYGCRD
jgi:hypothetical protein